MPAAARTIPPAHPALTQYQARPQTALELNSEGRALSLLPIRRHSDLSLYSPTLSCARATNTVRSV